MQPNSLTIIIGGAILGIILLAQVAIGKRWIQFGKRQIKIHAWVAWLIVGLAAAHAVGALALLGYIPQP